MGTLGKTKTDLTELAADGLRTQPGCETATVTTVVAGPELKVHGVNWLIGMVNLGNSSIEDVQRGTIVVNRELGRQFHLLEDS